MDFTILPAWGISLNSAIYIDKLIKPLAKKQLFVLLVLISYLFQGLASLIYQVSWEQATENIVGMALPTMAIVVSMLFVGMAIGAYVFEKILVKVNRPGQLFVLSQTVLFLFGLLFIFGQKLNFFSAITADSYQSIFYAYSLRLLLVCAFLLLPAIFIGAGFPLLLRFIGNVNFNATKLYFVNLAGAIGGAIMVGFVLLPYLGISKTVLLASLMNLVAGIIFLLAMKRGPFSRVDSEEKISVERSYQSGAAHKNNRLLSLLVVMAGPFFNMLLELLFFRIATLFMGSTAFAFSLVLAFQLFALGCGAFAANIYKIRKENCWKVFASLYLFAAFWLLLDLAVLPSLAIFIVGQTNFLQTYFHLGEFAAFFISNSIILLVIIFIPSFCLGINLPLYFQLQQIDTDIANIKPAYAYALNLFSSVGGCLVGGIFIIPCLSVISKHAISWSLCLSAIATFTLALLIYCFGTKGVPMFKVRTICFLTWIVLFTTIVYLRPTWCAPLTKEKAQLLFYKEGLNSTVSLSKSIRRNIIYLQTDGQTEATLPLNPKISAQNSDAPTHTLLATLPMIFCSDKDKEAFLLGLGSGLTAKTLLSNLKLKRLMIAELEPCVIEAAKYLDRYYQFDLPSLDDQRVQIVSADGRNILSLQNKTYDVIVSQPGEPWRSSSKYLYTLEFWQLVKSRLDKNGVFCQWFPLYSIDKRNFTILCETFTSVFDQTYAIRPKGAGEILLLGLNGQDRSALKEAMKFLPNNLMVMSPANFNIEKGNQKNGLNSDDYPFVQYQLQSILLHNGLKTNIDAEHLVQSMFCH